MTRLPIVIATGSPTERGRTIGRALPDAVGRSLAGFAVERERLGVDGAELRRRVAPLLARAERSLPAHVETLRGIAAGAGVPFLDVFAVNAWEEVLPDPMPRPGRCTSVAIRTPDDAVLLGHNEQWTASELGNVAIIVERPDDAVAVISPTPASMLAAVGVNAHGVAVAVDSLVARDDGPGLPRVLASRHVLEARDAGDLLVRARLRERAGGYGYVLADASAGVVGAVEQTATRAEPLDAADVVCHTNHYLHPALAALGAPPSRRSRSRLAELRARLEAAPPTTAEELAVILAGHDGDPEPICVHPTPGDPAASAILFSMVYDGGAGRLLVTGGNPCEGTFEELDLADLLGLARSEGRGSGAGRASGPGRW